jgi:apolipoprotein N-acyltransferase
MEFLRARWPVGGLTWAGLGFGLAPYDWARGAAAWIGASGWTVVIVGVAALLLDRIQHRQGRAWIAGSVGLAVLLLLGLLYPATAQGAALEVTIVQGNSPCPRDHCAGEREQIFDAHLRLTRTIEPGTADLVVWAESSTGFSTDPLLNPSYAELIGEEARRIGAFFLIGGDRPLDDGHFVNANMLFGPDGRYLGEYNKQHAVPFGEYVPWRSVFGRIPATDRVPRDMVPGSGPVVFDLGPGTIGSVISFEGAFARYLREHVQAGAELLVVTTNESSYGVGPAADQLIGMTRMHAAANGVDLVQAAVTGRSVIITNGGELPEATPLYEEAVLDGVVRFRQSGPTLYTRWGDWLQIMLAAAATVLVVVRRLRNTEGHGTWPSESRL